MAKNTKPAYIVHKQLKAQKAKQEKKKADKKTAHREQTETHRAERKDKSSL